MNTKNTLVAGQQTDSSFDLTIDQAERLRQRHFLKNISLVMLIMFSAILVIYPVVGFIFSQSILYFGIIPTFISIMGFVYSMKVTKPEHYIRGCWVLITSGILVFGYTTWVVGVETPVIIGGFNVVAFSLVLLNTRSTIIVGVLYIISFSGLYLAQDVFYVFDPLLSMSHDLRAVVSILIIVMVIPTTVSLMLIPHTTQIKALKNQYKRLQQTLNELELRQKSTQQASQQALTLASELHSTATQQTNGSQQQASALSQVTSFMQEMAQTAASIAEKTYQLSLATDEIKLSSETVQHTISSVVETGEKGGEAVKRTIESNTRVSELYTNLKQTLSELEQRQGQIKEAVAILQTISNETHLLSLNAAIEAAGAGMYGERFAVVASEVRSLADRARISSEVVSRKLGEIEERIQIAVEKVESGFEESQKALIIAQESGTVMNELVENINKNAAEVAKIQMLTYEVTEQSREINYATNQQSSASSQATDTLREIGAVALQIATGSMQITNNAGGLEKLSENLIKTLVA